jgi:hypothetical protein
MAALESHHDIGLFRQPVDDLALPLVSPLGTDDDNIGHFASSPSATVFFSSMICEQTRHAFAAIESGPHPKVQGHAFFGSHAEPKSPA